ncbi:MAG: hypothetical protein ACRD0S_07675 [Acidimicrobiales bacterium]
MPDVAPARAGSPSGWRRVGPWARLVIVGGFAGAACFPALLLIAWFTFAGARFGWVLTAGAFGLLGLAAGWAAVTKRWPVARRRTTAGLAAVLALVGIAAAHAAPPTPGRLRHAIRQFEQPAWHLVDDTLEGNALCFDACWSLTRQYRVDADPDAVLRDLRPPLTRRGLQPAGAPGERLEFADRSRGDIGMRVSLVRRDGGGTTVYISADANG